MSLFFPASATLGDSRALLLVIEHSVLQLPARMGAEPSWYSHAANFQLAFSLAGVQEDATAWINESLLYSREEERRERGISTTSLEYCGNGACHCQHRSLCNCLAFAYGFASLSTPEQLDKTKLRLGKQWKLILSNKKSVKHFYKL